MKLFSYLIFLNLNFNPIFRTSPMNTAVVANTAIMQTTQQLVVSYDSSAPQKRVEDLLKRSEKSNLNFTKNICTILFDSEQCSESVLIVCI